MNFRGQHVERRVERKPVLYGQAVYYGRPVTVFAGGVEQRIFQSAFSYAPFGMYDQKTGLYDMRASDAKASVASAGHSVKRKMERLHLA
jgi:hypothetical protein